MTYAVAVNVFGWWAQIHPGVRQPALHSPWPPPPRPALTPARPVHLPCWQHGIFEGRKPALLDSFFQSIVLAPFFVFNEVLFWMGFRADLKKRLDAEVAKRKAARARKSQ